MLRTEHGVAISNDETADETALGDAQIGSWSGLEGLLGNCRRRSSKVRGLNITARLIVGNFLYTNMAMVDDLDNSLETLAANDLVLQRRGCGGASETLRNAGLLR